MFHLFLLLALPFCPKIRKILLGILQVSPGVLKDLISEDMTQFEPLVECSANRSGDITLLGPLGVRLSLDEWKRV
jgi:hypothetical protein